MQIGGTATGKIIELMGLESSGKSTIVLHQIAEYQKAFPNKRVALFDYEHSLDKKYAAKIGVDIDKLLIYQPDYMEQGYDMILGLISNDIVSCVVVDSQSAAPPKAVLEGEMGDSTIGLQARINSKFCQKVKGLLAFHNTTLFIVSQMRDKIGGMGEGMTTTGGRAYQFYADVRWKLWKTANKENEVNITTIDVIKSKVGKPFGQAKVGILWGIGFDKIGEIIDYAVEFNIIQKSGSWFAYGETKLGQGTKAVKALFADNPEFADEIKQKVTDVLMKTKIEEPLVIEDE
jgi:recombination protein RecA